MSTWKKCNMLFMFQKYVNYMRFKTIVYIIYGLLICSKDVKHVFVCDNNAH